MQERGASEDPETCDLCASSGPPKHPRRMDMTYDDTPDLQWIACQKCDKWLHSACVIASDSYKVTTIPAELREMIEWSGEGIWFDWADKVAKWYCKDCIENSASPSNPKPPRTPLVTTLKKPRIKGRRTSTGSPTAKRARLTASTADDTPPPASATPETPTEGRPKRRAALERPDYHSMHNHVATPTKQWVDLIKDPAKYGRVIREDNFPRLPGSVVRKDWVESSRNASDTAIGEQPATQFPGGLFYGPTREPVVVHPDAGGLASMGGMIPDPSLTVDDVSRLVGPDKMVDVIDVASQTSSQWPLAKWAEYVKTRSDPTVASSSKVYNIISLEISGTELAQMVRPPQIVSDVDWVENFWPFPHGKEATMRAAAKAADGAVEEVAVKGKAKSEWPKVQLYCLMGMKDSWTDWHIDFAASSVYYSVHTGSKVFFFIRPTESNLAAYTQWSGSAELQASTWLPDMCDEVRKVTLTAGDTMIIPAGYIHAVFTPVDSIVFGGNFVHSYDIPTQLRLRQIEIDTKVPQRFRFPFFDKLCWYVAQRYVSDLGDLRQFRPNGKPSEAKAPYGRVLNGLVVLARFLIQQVAIMEDSATEDKQRRLIWNRIPSEISNPAALALELQWRAERELPGGWEDEDEVKVKPEKAEKKGRKKATNGVSAPAKKLHQQRVASNGVTAVGSSSPDVKIQISEDGSDMPAS